MLLTLSEIDISFSENKKKKDRQFDGLNLKNKIIEKQCFDPDQNRLYQNEGVAIFPINGPYSNIYLLVATALPINYSQLTIAVVNIW